MPGPANLAVRSSEPIIHRFGQGTGTIAIVLDCSGSMRENHKWDNAKAALIQVLKPVPRGTIVSIWTFGQLPEGIPVDDRGLATPGLGPDQINQMKTAAAELERTIKPLRKPAAWDPNQADDLAQQLNRLYPYFDTPLIQAMATAAKQDLDHAKGIKTLLVLTDGMDTGFSKNTRFSPNRIDIPAFINTYFQPMGIRINMVYFGADEKGEELKQAREVLAKPLQRLDPPGTFVTADNLDQLIESLKQGLKQRLTCQILKSDGTPVPGDPLDVTDVRAGEDVWWPTGLPPGIYILRVQADRAYQQEIQLNAGDRVVLQLGERPDGGIAFARLLDERGESSNPP